MHELLFQNSPHLKEKQLLDYAAQLGLDLPRYQNEMNDHVCLQRVQKHMQGARHLGVRLTPAFYVNGVFSDVSFGLEHLHVSIDKTLARCGPGRAGPGQALHGPIIGRFPVTSARGDIASIAPHKDNPHEKNIPPQYRRQKP